MSLEKVVFDRLVAAEWVEQVSQNPPKQPNTAGTQSIHWLKDKASDLDGQQKMILFSQLYRELLKGGPITADDVSKLVGFGHVVSIMAGVEKPPQS